MNRKQITEKLERYSYPGDILTGTIDEVILRLQALKTKYILEGYSNLRLEDESYYESWEVCLYGQRDETDAEVLSREKAEERERKYKLKLKKEKEENERKQYERLKKKFEETK